jgi:hypothetical protein
MLDLVDEYELARDEDAPMSMAAAPDVRTEHRLPRDLSAIARLRAAFSDRKARLRCQ